MPPAIGAVHKPALVIVPPDAVHVTAVFVVLVTVAVNCCVAPACTLTVTGRSATVIGNGGDVDSLLLHATSANAPHRRKVADLLTRGGNERDIACSMN